MHICRCLGSRDEKRRVPKARPEGPPLRGSARLADGVKGSRPLRVSWQCPKNHTGFKGRNTSSGSPSTMDEATEKTKRKKEQNKKNCKNRMVRSAQDEWSEQSYSSWRREAWAHNAHRPDGPTVEKRMERTNGCLWSSQRRGAVHARWPCGRVRWSGPLIADQLD